MQTILLSLKANILFNQIPRLVLFSKTVSRLTAFFVLLAIGFTQQLSAQPFTTPGASPASVSNVIGVGTVAWTNPGSAVSDDNNYATVALNNSTSNYLQATNFGFAIPTTANITGITVTISRFGSGNAVRDNVVKLIKGGTVSGNSLAVTGTNWPTTETALTYGPSLGSTGWNLTFTPAEINASNFGVALAVNSANSRTASVDYIKISVTYTGGTYKSVFTSPPSTGSANWCPGETRTVSVTVKNNGTFPWTDGPGGTPDFNIGVKWDGDADYFIRTDVAGLAAGATGTYNLTVTAPAASTNHLTFDIVYEGVSWFGDGNGGIGTTGNGKLVSPIINILGTPTATAGGSQSVCQTGTATVSGASSSNGTILWTHNGQGTLTNATTLTPTYTPAAADAGNTVILTMTVSNPCTPTTATATYSVQVKATPTATAGGSQTICQTSTATVSGATATNGTIAWTENGAGSITSGANTLTPTYTPTAGDAGNTVTLTMTVSNNPCTAATATYSVIVNGSPTATAGGSQNICQTGTATVSGASASNGTIAWTENGAGSVTSGANTLTPTYTPAAGDAGNTVTLTMTVTSNNICAPATATATYSVNVKATPTATAGGSSTICQNGTATVSGATATNGTIAWTENGAGSITSGATTLTPTYTAAAGDAGNTVTLTMTVSNSPCTAATATYSVIVNGLPTATAGGSQTICHDATATVSGATATNGTIAWTENGAGSITSGATTLTPTYTAAAGDAGNTVTLTMTVTSNNACAPATATATYTVIVSSSPTTTGAVICQNGGPASLTASSTCSGFVNSGTAISGTWTAATDPIANRLTGSIANTATCSFASITRNYKAIDFQVSTNGSYTFTMNNNTNYDGMGYIVSGAFVPGNCSGGGTWIKGDDDSNPAGTSDEPQMSATLTAGTTYTLISTTYLASAGTFSGSFAWTITPPSGGQIMLMGTVPVQWYTNASGGTAFGTGSPFNPVGVANSGLPNTQTPGTYTFYAACPAFPNCRTATTYVINPAATVSAGANQIICAGTTATMAGSFGGGASSATWTTSGTGTFSNNTPTAVYTPSAADIIAGSRTLTYTTNDPAGPCSAVNASMTLTINPAATVSAGANQTICAGTTATMAGSFGGGASSATWSTSGTGTFNNNNTNAIYTPSPADATAGSVTLTYTTNDPAGPCGAVNASMTLSINPAAAVSAGANQTICAGTTATMAGSFGGGASSATWSTSGTGTFNNNNTNAIYTPSAADATAGSVTLTYTTNDPAGPCGAVNASITLSINPLPIATITANNSPICSGSTASFTLTGTSGAEVTYNINGSPNATVTLTGGTATVSVSNATADQTLNLVSVNNPSTNCSQSLSGTSTVTVSTQPTVTISYAGSPYCSKAGNATVTFNGTPTNGTFSSDPGLSIDANTGTVNIGLSNSGTYTVTYTLAGSGPCGNYTTQTTIQIDDNIWTGNNSTSWNNALNWTCGVPDSFSNVLIIEAGNSPVVDGVNSVRDITINGGASLSTAAPSGNTEGELTIKGNYYNGGSLANNGMIILKGNVAQTFPGGDPNPVMHSLEINNTNGVSFDQSFTITGKLVPTAGTVAVGNNYITLRSDSTRVGGFDVFNSARVAPVGATASFTYSTGGFVIERYFHSKRAWRLMTAPIMKTGSPSIYNAWQLGGAAYNAGTNKGKGELVTGPGASPSNGLDQAVTPSSSLKTYNSVTGGFVVVSDTKNSLLSPGTHSTGGTAENIGYFNFVRGDRNPALVARFYPPATAPPGNSTTLRDTGRLQTGTQTFTFSLAVNTNVKFILLPNPYASPIDFTSIYAANSGTLYYNGFTAWDPEAQGSNSVGAYVTYDGIDQSTTPPSPGGQRRFIQSTQAVYIQTIKSGTASIIINESDKSDSTTTGHLFRPLVFSIAQIAANLKYLNGDNSTILADGIKAQFSTSFSDAVDMKDALKFANMNESFSFMRNGKLLTIERRNLLSRADTLFLDLTKASQRSYQLEFIADGFNQSGFTGYLEDSYLKTSTPISLSGTTTVNFSITANAASQAKDRFRIVFRPSATLPVTFTKVKAYQQGGNINVEWTIGNEMNMKEYELEKSTDGSRYIKIVTLMPTRNNGTTASYSSPDVSPLSGTNYYRIHCVGKNGEAQYSNIVSVNITKGIPQMMVYPNPVIGGTINLQMVNQPKGTYNLRLINKLGQVLLTKEVSHEEGSSTETLQMSKGMAHGMYQLEVTTPANIKTTTNVIY